MAKKITYIAPANIQSIITGVHHIEISGNNVTLVYVDFTQQSKKLKPSEREGLDFFALVSAVQN